MKKLKMVLMTAAVLIAAAGVYATRPCLQCEYDTQYQYTGGGYIEAGTWGIDYSCSLNAGTCTYYKPDPVGHPNAYAPCRTGTYTPF